MKSTGTTFVAVSVAAVAALAIGASAQADFVDWNRGASTNLWNTGGNWVGGSVPGTDDSAAFTNAAANVQLQIDQNTAVGRVYYRLSNATRRLIWDHTQPASPQYRFDFHGVSTSVVNIVQSGAMTAPEFEMRYLSVHFNQGVAASAVISGTSGQTVSLVFCNVSLGGKDVHLFNSAGSGNLTVGLGLNSASHTGRLDLDAVLWVGDYVTLQTDQGATTTPTDVADGGSIVVAANATVDISGIEWDLAALPTTYLAGSPYVLVDYSSGGTVSGTSSLSQVSIDGGWSLLDDTVNGQVVAYQPIPEPATVSLLAIGAIGLIVRRRPQTLPQGQ